jgi:hypothetical protein
MRAMLHSNKKCQHTDETVAGVRESKEAVWHTYEHIMHGRQAGRLAGRQVGK